MQRGAGAARNRGGTVLRLLIAFLFTGLAGLAGPEAARAQAERTEYYMAHAGREAGPYFIDELRTRMLMGRLRRDTPVWTTGMAAWQPAAEVPEVGALFDPALPPIPKERDFGRFVQGTWRSEPVTTELPGLGRGVATGETVFRADGIYSFTGQVDLTDAAGSARAMRLASEGGYSVTRKAPDRFEIVFAAPLVMTLPSDDPAEADRVERTEVPPAEFEVIDDNTIRDAQGTVSRRKI
ncbi:hypothetical protein FIU89_06160 [Roseovarius sp. THAF27]|nr:hypothetical protein FIU89_06160 [Roseovarius sp. THAF27]